MCSLIELIARKLKGLMSRETHLAKIITWLKKMFIGNDIISHVKEQIDQC